MNALGEILTAADVALDVDVASRDRLFEFVAALIARRHGISATDVASALATRESLGCTALGHGVAMPHARMAGLLRPIAVFTRTRQSIAFGAADGRPVSNFVVLLVPAQAANYHLKLIAEAAALFNDPTFRAQLQGAEHPDDVANMFAQWPLG